MLVSGTAKTKAFHLMDRWIEAGDLADERIGRDEQVDTGLMNAGVRRMQVEMNLKDTVCCC